MPANDFDWANFIGQLGSAYLGYRGSQNAAGDMVRGNNAAIDEQRRQFDYLANLFAPSVAVGHQARNRVAELLGLNPVNPTLGGGATTGEPLPGSLLPGGGREPSGGGANGVAGYSNSGSIPSLGGGGSSSPGGMWVDGYYLDKQTPPGQPAAAPTENLTTGTAPSSAVTTLFQGSPSQQFIQDQARRQTEASAAGRGGAFSGGVGIALAERASQIAATDFNNEINRLLALASGGQAAQTSLATNSSNSSLGISNLLSSIGQSNAAGTLGRTNTLQDLINGVDWGDLFGSGGGGGGGASYPGTPAFNPVPGLTDQNIIDILTNGQVPGG